MNKLKISKTLFKPNFSDNFFIYSLFDDNEIINNAKNEYLIGNFKKSQELIAEYFRTRTNPKFFIDINDVENLVNSIINNHPEWRYQTLESVRRMFTEGVDVFSKKTDPLTCKNFWKNLEKGIGQDILYKIKPYLFDFTPQLALAAHYGELTPPALEAIIISWQDVSLKESLSYTSDLAVFTRIVSLSWTYFFLAALKNDIYPYKWRLEYTLLKIIHTDAVFLSKIEGKSTPNNHLMLYEFSKFYIGTLFPEFKLVKKWTASQPESWINELKRQAYSDGGIFEPSIHYQQLFCETAIAYVLLCKRNSLPPDSWVNNQLELFLAFQIKIGGEFCIPLRIGDSSDLDLFALDSDKSNMLASLREIYRNLYDSSLGPVFGNNYNIEMAFWVLGGQLVLSSEMLPKTNENQFISFKESGYYVFNDKKPQTRLVFRTGPSTNCDVFAGHMHADLLSVYFAINGVPFIVNSGTYTYRSNMTDWPKGTPPWRRFFMGPESKNTIFIENHDPLGDVNADFRVTHTKTRINTTVFHSTQKLNWVEGEIINANLYSNLRRGVIHLVNDYWVVYDVTGTDNVVHMGLQLSEKVEFEQNDHSIVMCQDEEFLSLAWSSSLHLTDKLNGSLTPLGGWISEKYGVLKKATYLKFKIAEDKALTACVFIAGIVSHPAIDIKLSAFDAMITEVIVKTESFTDYIFFRADGCSGDIINDKIELNVNAAMLIIRFDINNNPILLKALNFNRGHIPCIGLMISCKNTAPWLDVSLVDRCHIYDENIFIEWV